KDERTVGNPPERVRERSLLTWNLMHLHHPSGSCEALAHPAVVGVAAARPSRVVDALRDDEVDGHSARSEDAEATGDSGRGTTRLSSSPAETRSASLSAIRRASASVVVFRSARLGSSSRFR